MITVVLVSNHSEQAYYEREEIAAAIDMARRDPDRRVVPVYLAHGAGGREDIPYGLRLKHGLTVEEEGGLGEVARKLLGLLRRPREKEQPSDTVPPWSAVRPPEWLRSSTAAFVGRTERGPATPTFLTSWSDYEGLFGGETDPAISYLSHSVKGYFENGGERAYVVRILSPVAAVAGLTLTTESAQQCVWVAALTHGDWGNRLSIQIRDGTRVGFRLSVTHNPTRPPRPRANPTGVGEDDLPDSPIPEVLEDYDNLGWDPEGPNYFLGVNGKSKWITLQWCDPLTPPARPVNGHGQLAGGADGPEMTAADYLGDRATRTGLAALEDLDDISILCVPDHVHPRLGDAEQLQLTNAVVDQCERRRDRFAILSAPTGIEDVAAIRPPRDSKLAAMYYPWVRVPDPHTRGGVLIPPVGHVGGIYARSDAERGVHRAPVGLEVRGLMIPDTDGPLEINVTPEQLDTLERLGVNAIRAAGTAGGDVRVAGARTMAVEERWQSIAQQRFSIFLAQSFERGSGWVTFEPNDETVWTKLRENIGDFLTALWEVGALGGGSAEEAFFVRCDRTTMTQNDIDNGRLVCVIGVSCVEPPVSIIFHLVIPVALPSQSKLTPLASEVGGRGFTPGTEMMD